MVLAMPAPLPNVDREAVRVLAAAVGQREAARQMGLSENTVKTICYRAGDGKRIQAAISVVSEKSIVRPDAPKPAEALEKIMEERKQQSRLGASKYVARVMEEAGETGKLSDAPKLKDVADIMGKVWPEQSGPATAIQLNIMQIGLGNETE